MRLGAYAGEAAAGLDRADGLRRGGHLRAPPPPLRGQQQVPRPGSRRPGSCARARRPTTAWSSSSSCPTTRSSSAPRRTPSSRAAPTARTRCSRRSCRRRANGPRAGCPRLPLPIDAEPDPTRHRVTARDATELPGRRRRARSCDAGFLSASRAARRRTATARSSTATSCTTRARSSWCRSIDDDAVLVRQYRVAAGRELLEMPAGKRDVDGRGHPRPPRRELEEEIGYRRRPARPLVRVLQLARLLRRVHLPVPRHRARGSASARR